MTETGDTVGCVPPFATFQPCRNAACEAITSAATGQTRGQGVEEGQRPGACIGIGFEGRPLQAAALASLCRHWAISRQLMRLPVGGGVSKGTSLRSLVASVCRRSA